jgi:hypothetical protein
MLIIRYERVVSRLPLFVEQNINVEAPLKFQKKTRSKNIKDTSIKVIPQLTVFWDKHITLKMTAMLSRKCLKLENEDSI